MFLEIVQVTTNQFLKLAIKSRRPPLYGKEAAMASPPSSHFQRRQWPQVLLPGIMDGGAADDTLMAEGERGAKEASCWE